MRTIVLIVGLALLAGQGAKGNMDRIAEQYVKLVLAIGQHDADFVDAYYGPPEWKKEADRKKIPLQELSARAQLIAAQLADAPEPADEMSTLRLTYLRKQVAAVSARLRMMGGE